eukprot:12767816-Prorocentrum_lima.AAC.1
MTSSLVGSEMCIRDRPPASDPAATASGGPAPVGRAGGVSRCRRATLPRACLLYTSDAADDM